MFQLGLATEFRSEKIQRNRLGTVSVILRKKVLIPTLPRHSKVHGKSIPKLGTERNCAEKISSTKQRKYINSIFYCHIGKNLSIFLHERLLVFKSMLARKK
jgi:hypothetical protein